MPPPSFCISVASKGVTKGLSVSIADKRVGGGQFRPKTGETRYLSASIDFKAVVLKEELACWLALDFAAADLQEKLWTIRGASGELNTKSCLFSSPLIDKIY
jgi:hypothetical protein